MTKKQWCLKELLIYPEGTKDKGDNYIGCKEKPISEISTCLPIIKARQEKFVPKTLR
tara:strand:- start:2271 stop:2441 length:171 start_codon:yes stop_codon:yes gene_type:complete